MKVVNWVAALLTGFVFALIVMGSYIDAITGTVMVMFFITTALLAIACLVARRQSLERARTFALVSAAAFVGPLLPMAIRHSSDAVYIALGAILVFCVNLAAALLGKAPAQTRP